MGKADRSFEVGKDSVQLKSIEAAEATESDGNGENQIEKGGKLEREDELGFFFFFLSNGEGTEKKMFRNILLGKIKKNDKKRKKKKKTLFQLFVLKLNFRLFQYRRFTPSFFNLILIFHSFFRNKLFGIFLFFFRFRNIF